MIILIVTISLMGLLLPAYWCFKRWRKETIEKTNEKPYTDDDVFSEANNAAPHADDESRAVRQFRVPRNAPERNLASWERKVKNVSQNGYRD